MHVSAPVLCQYTMLTVLPKDVQAGIDGLDCADTVPARRVGMTTTAKRIVNCCSMRFNDDVPDVRIEVL